MPINTNVEFERSVQQPLVMEISRVQTWRFYQLKTKPGLFLPAKEPPHDRTPADDHPVSGRESAA